MLFGVWGLELREKSQLGMVGNGKRRMRHPSPYMSHSHPPSISLNNPYNTSPI